MQAPSPRFADVPGLQTGRANPLVWNSNFQNIHRGVAKQSIIAPPRFLGSHTHGLDLLYWQSSLVARHPNFSFLKNLAHNFDEQAVSRRSKDARYASLPGRQNRLRYVGASLSLSLSLSVCVSAGRVCVEEYVPYKKENHVNGKVLKPSQMLQKGLVDQRLRCIILRWVPCSVQQASNMLAWLFGRIEQAAMMMNSSSMPPNFFTAILPHSVVPHGKKNGVYPARATRPDG